MSSYGEKFNGYICSDIVVDTASMEEFWTASQPSGDYWLYDPGNWWIPFDQDLDEEGEAAIAELEAGDVQGVAHCRALYDLNNISGGFCCQTLGLEMTGISLQFQEAEMINDWSTYAQGGEVTFEYYGEEATVYWGAEYFGSADGMTASIIAMTATVMAFTQ